MIKIIFKTLVQTAAITAAAAAIAVATNAVRSDGIPLVTDVEYEIFSPCEDSEVKTEAVETGELVTKVSTLYVDARPQEAFAAEHVDGAVNLPYSVLFGAPDEDIEKAKAAAKGKGAARIIVYGVFEDPANPGEKVDLAEPLAEQLIESGLQNVKHLEGGLEELKKNGAKTVKGTEGDER